MPCYHCGARQSDPDRGPSAWRRGVRAGSQVLVCPDCQGSHDWIADLDPCARCGSRALAKVLGDTRCRDCGLSTEGPAPAHDADTPGLAEDVAAALERVLGRRAD